MSNKNDRKHYNRSSGHIENCGNIIEQNVRICSGCSREFIPEDGDEFEEFCIDCRGEG